jgi:hypothetical protein
MSFQWLTMRIQEEKERRDRESAMLLRLPVALEELHANIKECVVDYTRQFGAESADVQLLPLSVKVTAKEERDGRWQPAAKVEVIIVPEIPGFRVERGEYSVAIEVGVLPSDNLFYRDREQNVYLSLEDLTKRILDRALFPKLTE